MTQFLVICVLFLACMCSSCTPNCRDLCAAFNSAPSCYLDCGCDPIPEAAVEVSITEEYISLLTSWNCSYVYINACYHAVDYQNCMSEAGCAEINTPEWLVSKVPPYLWKATKPAHLDLSSSLTAGIAKLSKCQDCIDDIGDDYWECIDDYCRSTKVEFKSSSPGKSITAQVVYMSVIDKVIKLCDCYEMCETLSGDEYYACTDSCEYTSECSRRNDESFELLKSVMKIQTTLSGGSGNIESLKVEKVNFVCGRSCVEQNCGSGDEGCFDRCREACPSLKGFGKIEGMLLVDESGMGVEGSGDEGENNNIYGLLQIQGAILIAVIAVMMMVISKRHGKENENSAMSTPYRIIS